MSLNKEDIILIIISISNFLREYTDYILNFTIILSCLLLYINIPKVILILFKDKSRKDEVIERCNKNFKTIYWFFIFLLILFFIYDFLYPEVNTDLLNSTSYYSRRTLKFSLAIILNISSLYINFKSYGLKSWRTLLSLVSILSTILLAGVFYSDKFSNFVKLGIIKTIEIMTVFWLLIVLIIENKAYVEINTGNFLLSKPEILINKPKNEFGPLKVDDKSRNTEIIKNNEEYEYTYSHSYSKKVIDKSNIDEGDELKRRRVYLPPTKPIYDPNNKLSPYNKYNLLYRDSDRFAEWREKYSYKFIRKPKTVKFLERYYDIENKKYEPHNYVNSKEFAESELDVIYRKKDKNYKPTKPDWPQNKPKYNQKYKLNWYERQKIYKPKYYIDNNLENKLSRRKIIHRKYSHNKVLFVKGKGMLINNYPLNQWNNYVKMKSRNNFYIKPDLIEVKTKNNNTNYQWKKNTSVIRRINNINSEINNQIIKENQNLFEDNIKKKNKYLREKVYLDRMEIESKYKSIYVDVDDYTGKVYIREMPINDEKRNSELKIRKENLEKLIKYKKNNENLYHIKINDVDKPLPWYTDRRVLYVENVIKSGFKGWKRPGYIDLPLSKDNSLVIFDPNRFNFKDKYEKIEAGMKIKKTLTSSYNVDSIESILYRGLFNDDKEMKKKMKKNKPILMVEDEYFYKRMSKKEKIKYFFRKHTLGLFKNKVKITKEIIENKDQEEKISNIIREEKNKSFNELKNNQLDERMTPPLLRESDSESEISNLNSKLESKPYVIRWKGEEILVIDKSSLPPTTLPEEEDLNKSLYTNDDKKKLIKKHIILYSGDVSNPLNKLAKRSFKLSRWVKGLPPLIQEELKDEDLPVLPYRSKNKGITEFEKLLIEDIKEKLRMYEYNDKERLIGRERNNKSLSENVIKDEKPKIENQVQDKKKQIEVNKLKEKEIQDNKFKKKSKDVIKKSKEEQSIRTIFSRIFNKEFDVMFPKNRPEDFNWDESWKSRETQEEKELAFQLYSEKNLVRLNRKDYNPIYPDPVEDDEISSNLDMRTETKLVEDTTQSITIGEVDKVEENKSNEIAPWEKYHNEKWNYYIEQYRREKKPKLTPEQKWQRKYPNIRPTNDILNLFKLEQESQQEEVEREIANLIKQRDEQREAMRKHRAELLRHGINPDKHDYWRNALVIENICTVIMDKVRNGIDYKLELLEDEHNFLRLTTLNKYEIAKAWENVFQGGKPEEKLDAQYYKDLDRLELIPHERIILLDLQKRVIKYKLEICRHQLLREVKFPTRKAADSLEDSRMTWIQEVIENPEKQIEVYNHALDYIKRVKNNENAGWCRRAAPFHIDWAEFFLSRQKPGTLNFNLFDPEKADRFTLDMIDKLVKEELNEMDKELKREEDRIQYEKWRRENPEEVQKQYEELVEETDKAYKAFKEEQRQWEEEMKKKKKKYKDIDDWDSD